MVRYLGHIYVRYEQNIMDIEPILKEMKHLANDVNITIFEVDTCLVDD